MALNIRQATAADAAEMQRMLRALQTERGITGSSGFSEPLLAKMLNSSTGWARVLLATGGAGQAIGFAMYQVHFSVFRGGPSVFIDCVYVKEAHRRTGVGRALLAEVASLARREGIGGLTWFAAKSSAKEQALIAKLGIRPFDNLRFARVPIGVAVQELGPAASSLRY